MNFYLYLIICLITQPIRWLQSLAYKFIPLKRNYTNLDYALKLLINNDSNSGCIYALSSFETDKFTSIACKKGKNYFGMRVSKEKKYQKGSIYAGPNVGTLASYWTVYHSLYDFYDRTTNSKRSGVDPIKYWSMWYKQAPKGEYWVKNGIFVPDLNKEIIQHALKFATLLKYINYHTSVDSENFVKALPNSLERFENTNKEYITINSGTIILFGGLIFYLSRPKVRQKIKTKYKKLMG